ncbi:MAG: murein L,D-transpeptidase [Alphaproteobacteria bacterium]|nr:murein L,D-transpeptidase [Alphaproteobacteria bacterium]
MEEKGLKSESPILIRIFKESEELEVWKMNNKGFYTLLITYPICQWSGILGPKKREGDYQSPEGFYIVKPENMNPRSKYYLSFDLGFPNKFDRSFKRTGSYLMVHGACSSVGCYAMTDSVMSDIYALAREAFKGDQPAFQIHAFPFRMTTENLLRYEGHPHYDFWSNLKEGYASFEAFHLPLKIGVCEGRYVLESLSVGMEQPIELSDSCGEWRFANGDRLNGESSDRAMGWNGDDDETGQNRSIIMEGP